MKDEKIRDKVCELISGMTDNPDGPIFHQTKCGMDGKRWDVRWLQIGDHCFFQKWTEIA